VVGGWVCKEANVRHLGKKFQKEVHDSANPTIAHQNVLFILKGCAVLGQA
jgi:hypothetical protein